MKVESYEEIGDIMLDDLMGNKDVVSMVADFDIVWIVARYLEAEYGLDFELIDVDKFSYDKEYYLTLMYNDDEEPTIAIEKAFIESKGIYISSSGNGYIHAGVNKKFFEDIANNKWVKPNTIVWSTKFEDFEEEDSSNNTPFELCMDDDRKGFCACYNCDNHGFHKFKYRGAEPLSYKDVNEILSNSGWL